MAPGRNLGIDPNAGQFHQLSFLDDPDARALDLRGRRYLSVTESEATAAVWDSGTGVTTELPDGVRGWSVNWIQNDIVAFSVEMIETSTGDATNVVAHRIAADGSVVWSTDLNPQQEPLVPYRTISSGDQVLVGFVYIEGGNIPMNWELIKADGTTTEVSSAGASFSPAGLILLDNQLLRLPDGNEIEVSGAVDIHGATENHVILGDNQGSQILVTLATNQVDALELPDGCALPPIWNALVSTGATPQEQLEALIESAGLGWGPGMHDSYPTVEVISDGPPVVAQSLPITIDTAVGDLVLTCQPQRIRLHLLDGDPAQPHVEHIAQTIIQAGIGCDRDA